MGGKNAERENKPGKLFSSSPITVSNIFCEVFCDAIKEISESVNVNDPPPNLAIAEIDISTASAQSGVGTPRPMLQIPCWTMPASLAALIILDFVFSVSAEHPSKLAKSSSKLKRTVKGEITGRGAVIFISS